MFYLHEPLDKLSGLAAFAVAALIGVFYFPIGWMPVRIIAWIVSGFRADRQSK